MSIPGLNLTALNPPHTHIHRPQGSTITYGSTITLQAFHGGILCFNNKVHVLLTKFALYSTVLPMTMAAGSGASCRPQAYAMESRARTSCLNFSAVDVCSVVRKTSRRHAVQANS
ncbi:unnamed protein product [Ectocarpus fasciculatus]